MAKNLGKPVDHKLARQRVSETGRDRVRLYVRMQDTHARCMYTCKLAHWIMHEKHLETWGPHLVPADLDNICAWFLLTTYIH